MIAETLNILWTYRLGFWQGLLVTMKLTACIWLLGVIGGTLLGLLGYKLPRTMGELVRVAAFLLSAVPAIVLLFWAYFPLQMLLEIDIEPFWTAAGTLTLLNMISVAEVIRRLLTEFPSQFRDAAKVCGLSDSRTFLLIELPLVARQAMPTVLLLQVSMLHLTLFASFISVEDIFRVAQRINSTIYRPVEIYSAVAILFLAISLPLQFLAAQVRNRIGITLRER